MNSDTLREFLKKRPFEPFAIKLSNGDRHEIRHPEFAIVSPSRLVVVDPVTERVSLISMIHIVEIQSLQTSNN
ncbi:MAG: hypothetical protein H0T47_11100 [Planctomycetaceae bacterium]|nr:hypothetical protein [Planctomycetaceae bacterium]